MEAALRACRHYGWRGLYLFGRLKSGVASPISLPGLKEKVHLRKGSSDIPTFIEIFFLREYELKIPFQPRVIIDGGANIGLSALYFKNRFPDCKIICVEPDSANFSMLQKNTASLSGITLINKALWHSPSSLSISDKYGMGQWGMVTEEMDGATPAGPMVETITISEIMEGQGIEYIDILKLDIETAEKELFRKNYELWLARTRIVVIELHDWVEKGCSKPFFEAVNKTFEHYSYATLHENTIIYNEDLVNG
jgi:FkbM family methyltransferase